MKKQKIANYLKTGVLFISVSLLLWSCEKNEILKLNQLSVPSIEQSKKAFLANKKLSKGANSFVSKIAWDKSSEILFKEDIKVLNSPLNIKSNKIKSFVTSIEKEGKVENQIITLLFDDDSNNDYFSGNLLIHNSEGIYVKGYKYEKGKKIGRYIIKASGYQSKGNCDPVAPDLETLLLLFEFDPNTDLTLFGCEAELNTVQGLDDGTDASGGYIDWQTPDNNLGDGNPNGGGTGFSWWTPVFSIFNNLTNPCAKDIFTDLEDGIFTESPLKPEVIVLKSDQNVKLNFIHKIMDMFTNSSKHFTIKNGNLGYKNAHTAGTVITMNNSYLNSASQLSIARTIIHESIHVYLNAQYNYTTAFNSLSFKEKMIKYGRDNGYNPEGTPEERNTFYHNFMGQYENAMAISLQDWDKEFGTGADLGFEYYQAMSYAGLFTVDTSGNISGMTDAFEALVSESKRQDVADIVINENNNNENAKGSECE